MKLQPNDPAIKWSLPPDIKIYEALGAIGDRRIDLEKDRAKVYSSGRRKHYTVRYDQDSNAIMANDNGSYWQGYLGYPAISYLLATGVISYEPKMAQYLAGFDWKKINGQFKNDWDKTADFVRGAMTGSHPELDLSWFDHQIEQVRLALHELNLVHLGPRERPPADN